MKKKEIERIAEENRWNADWHTIFILTDLKKIHQTPGEQYALQRAIKIVKAKNTVVNILNGQDGLSV